MKMSKMFPSNYLSKEDLEKPEIFTIDMVDMEKVTNEDGEKEAPVVYFTDDNSKPFILNKTNAVTLAEKFGEDSDDWSGRIIELFKDPDIMFRGKKIGGIRIRVPKASTTDAVPF